MSVIQDNMFSEADLQWPRQQVERTSTEIKSRGVTAVIDTMAGDNADVRRQLNQLWEVTKWPLDTPPQTDSTYQMLAADMLSIRSGLLGHTENSDLYKAVREQLHEESKSPPVAPVASRFPRRRTSSGAGPLMDDSLGYGFTGASKDI